MMIAWWWLYVKSETSAGELHASNSDEWTEHVVE